MHSEPDTDGRKRLATRLDYLLEASRLLASSLDYETTLATVARLALPELGAWCIVDLVEASGEMRRLAIVHPDPDKQRLARELESGWPPERDDPLGVPRVMHTRRSELIPHVTPGMLVTAARSERNLRILRELGIGSLVVVPLVARGNVLGAMTFVGAQEGREYAPDDLTFAEDLAGRCAIAIDNARLYREARSARTAAEEASRAKSEFLAMVSHEVRTPLNAIIGYAELLLMGLDGSLADAQREKLERIRVSSRHLLELLNQVLDLSRIEAEQLAVQRECAGTAGVVEEACEIVYPQAADKSMEVRNHCDADLAFVGDPARVRQILVNLLSNAVKFTPRGGRVEVRCDAIPEDAPGGPAAEGRGWVRIDVQDTGDGIPEEAQETIFEPFVQLSSGPTRTEGGAGLGLAISRRLARLMGGDLTVRSRVGEGSCFSLWLPGPSPGPGREVADEGALYAGRLESLPRLAALILERMEPILDRYVEHLRSDAGVPRGGESNDLELRGNALNFLTGVAQSLRTAREAGGAMTDAMRDGNRIQRVISELYGAQRHRLGWSQDALRRDFDLLLGAVREEVRAAAPDAAAIGDSLPVLERVFEHEKRTALQGWRSAEAKP